MKSVGLHAETYASAEDFLNCSNRDAPGCLILDVRMPGMSGLELQSNLISSGSRTFPHTTHVGPSAPIVGISNSCLLFTQELFHGARCLGYLYV